MNLIEPSPALLLAPVQRQQRSGQPQKGTNRIWPVPLPLDSLFFHPHFSSLPTRATYLLVVAAPNCATACDNTTVSPVAGWKHLCNFVWPFTTAIKQTLLVEHYFQWKEGGARIGPIVFHIILLFVSIGKRKPSSMFR